MIQLGSENAKKLWFSSLQEILKIQKFQIFSATFSKFQYFHQNWLEMKKFQWKKSIFEQKMFRQKMILHRLSNRKKID